MALSFRVETLVDTPAEPSSQLTLAASRWHTCTLATSCTSIRRLWFAPFASTRCRESVTMCPFRLVVAQVPEAFLGQSRSQAPKSSLDGRNSTHMEDRLRHTF